MPAAMISSFDKIAFTMEVEKRLSALASVCMQKTGHHLNPPADILAAMKRWRVMAQRYAMDMKTHVGASSHTIEEQQAEQELARWIIEETHKINNTKPDEHYQFSGEFPPDAPRLILPE